MSALRFEPMSAELYHADFSAVSKSMLTTFRKRRALYKAAYIDRSMMLNKSNRKMDLGTLAHAALLEPDQLDKHFIAYPPDLLAKDGAADTSRAKFFRAEQAKRGVMCLKEKDFAIVAAMAKSVRRTCADWINVESRKEHVIYWRDEQTGLPLKCRLDWPIIKPKRAFCFDLKTTDDASPHAFTRVATNFDYAIQAVHYSAGLRAATGLEVDWNFVVVETQAPFACAIYRIKPRDFDLAEQLWRRTLDELAQCLADDEWREPWEIRGLNYLEFKPWAFEDAA